MRQLIPTLSILFALSACSQSEPRPALEIPAPLLEPVAQPMMAGTTNGDLWRLIARQKASIREANSKLSAIRCIEDARQAIIDGADVPDC